MPPDPAGLRQLADLLDDDAIYDVVAGAIAEARDRGPRTPGDVDSAEVLDHVIAVVRDTAHDAALTP